VLTIGYTIPMDGPVEAISCNAARQWKIRCPLWIKGYIHPRQNRLPVWMVQTIKTRSEGEAMKREYEKPEYKKAVVTLQAVTAIANTTGSSTRKEA
jgi:hypothetical protein